MGILDEIVSRKRQRLKDSKEAAPLKELRRRIADIKKPGDFMSALKRSGSEKIRLIAEIKRASPSRGIIRKEFDHKSIAALYEEKNAVSAVSVLTEEDFFRGSLSFLRDVKKVLSKPVLRKDFIFDEYQIYESRAYEADAILLIAAILGRNQAVEYLHLAGELGLSVLFEVHNLRELEAALLVDADIIGINNRDLGTLKVDIDRTFELRKEIPSHKVIVSESGIRTREDVKRLEDAGVDAVLIGTSLMETGDTGGKIDELMGQI
jgi:indole-3-glycerol phosphate synthase